MTKPVIGITPDFDLGQDGRERYYLNNSYVEAVIAGGGIPLILPGAAHDVDLKEVLSRVDGVLLTGGNDHDPALFGEPKHEKAELLHVHRQQYELAIARNAIQMGKSIMGICLGSQTLNLAMGGTLIQDIPSQIQEPIIHSQKEARSKATHKVSIVKETLLHSIVGLDEIMVNSFHHQAVREPAPGLTISAKAEDGVVESIEGDKKQFRLGVQWHPECLIHKKEHLALFKAFIQASMKK